LKHFRTAFLFAFAWLLFVTILLCTPGTKLPRIGWSDEIWLDKWAHIFLFFVLVFLWCRAYIKRGLAISIKKIFFTIAILSTAYGIGMEIVQHYFIPFRSFDYGDMIADGIGSIAGYIISVNRFVKNKFRK
jgi:VanZ family protein